jgi:hypothetical protein
LQYGGDAVGVGDVGGGELLMVDPLWAALLVLRAGKQEEVELSCCYSSYTVTAFAMVKVVYSSYRSRR